MTTIKNRTIMLSVALGLAGVAMWLIVRLMPLGTDWYYCFRPLAQQWLAGESPIYEDYGCVLYFPWTFFITAPLALLPVELGNAMLVLVSAALLIASCIWYQRFQVVPFFAVPLAVVNLHSLDVLQRGQLDAFVVFGAVIGAWAVCKRRPLWLSLGLCLMMMKPPLNFALVGLLYLLPLRHWPRAQAARVFILPVIVLLLSFVMVGPDWPLRYITHIQEPIDYLSISLWRGADVLGWPRWPVALFAFSTVVPFLWVAWRDGVTPNTLALAITTNLLITTYANGNHYVLLIPAFLYLSSLSTPLAIIAYLLTWTPLSRAFLGYDAAVLDIGYVIVLWGTAWWYRLRTGSTELLAAPAGTTLQSGH